MRYELKKETLLTHIEEIKKYTAVWVLKKENPIQFKNEISEKQDIVIHCRYTQKELIKSTANVVYHI